LQYFGDTEIRRKTNYQLSPKFFEIIIDRDPRFFNTYLFLSTSVSIYAAQPQTSVELLTEGLTHMSPNTPPEAAIVWRYKGLDEFLFLKDFGDAQESYKTAAVWAEESPDPAVRSTAELSRQTANFIAENPNSVRTLIIGWSQVLSQAVDEATFNLAVDQINSFGGDVKFEEDGSFIIEFEDNFNNP
jgi:hypothetical protein